MMPRSSRLATLLIHPDNTASLTVAAHNGFERAEDVEERTLWKLKIRVARSDTPGIVPVSLQDLPSGQDLGCQ